MPPLFWGYLSNTYRLLVFTKILRTLWLMGGWVLRDSKYYDLINELPLTQEMYMIWMISSVSVSDSTCIQCSWQYYTIIQILSDNNYYTCIIFYYHTAHLIRKVRHFTMTNKYIKNVIFFKKIFFILQRNNLVQSSEDHFLGRWYC